MLSITHIKSAFNPEATQAKIENLPNSISPGIEQYFLAINQTIVSAGEKVCVKPTQTVPRDSK